MMNRGLGSKDEFHCDDLAARAAHVGIYLKDPNKPTLRTYEVPADTFDDGYAKEPME